MFRLGRRLLPLLQLTRMALVFTALADSGCALLLHVGNWRAIDPLAAVALAAVSGGLYGFGMSLNDIIDRRRDLQMARHRPLPSGRIGIAAAHTVCVLLALCAFSGVLFYWRLAAANYLTLTIFAFTLTLIVFYDLAGKYLVAPGLLTLGLIRFFHAAIAAPGLPVPWHPLLLLNHVTIVSTVAYHWEQKRPPLTKRHWFGVLGGLAGIDTMVIGAFAWRRQGWVAMAVTPGLLLPAISVLLFIVLAIWTRTQTRNARQAGQTLMLRGLLWLIVYDASFVAGFVGVGSALVILALLPIAYLSVQLMRWWNQLLVLSQRPNFKRIEA